MKRISVSYFGTNGASNPRFLSWEFALECQLAGIEFVEDSKSDEIWLVDLSMTGFLRSVMFRKQNRVLLIFEPATVNPVQHRGWVQSFFGRCVVFSSDQIKSENLYIEGGGLDPRRVVRTRPLRQSTEKRRVALAIGNKQSVSPTSLYWLRVDVIKSLLELGYEVHLAGNGWSDGVMANAKKISWSLMGNICSFRLPRISKSRPHGLGQAAKHPNLVKHNWVEDEVLFLASYDAAIIIENDAEFVSEKPFLAMLAGVPFVYVGPQDFQSYSTERCRVAKSADSAAVVAATREVLELPLEAWNNLDLDAIETRSFGSFAKRLALLLAGDGKLL